MAKIATIIMGLILGFSLCFNANARKPDGLEQQQLITLVEMINKKVSEKDYSVLVNSMPERLYKAMAIKMDSKESALRESFQQVLAKQFDIMVPNGYKLDENQIEYKEASDGSMYALIPTRIETKDKIIQSTTIAIYDNLRWNILLGGQKTVQNSVFLEIYPVFQDVTIPVGSVTKK